MAEVVIGDIVAKLRADAIDFLRGMQQAQQALSAFSAALTSQLGPAQQQLLALLTQLTQSQNTGTQSTNQLAAAYLAMAQATQQQTQVYGQAQAATLAYRREQDALRESLRQQRQAQQAANEEARQAAGALSHVVSGAFSVAGGLGIATSIQAAVSAMQQFATSVVETGTKLEGLRLGFAAIFGGQAGGTLAFNQTIGLAQRLGIEMVSLAEAYRRFEGAARGTALEGERGRRVFEAVTIAGRAMGSSSDQTAHALLALEQMVSKGCFDRETEVYTTEGWIAWPDITGEEKFLSCDPATPSYCEPQPAVRLVRFYHDGPMLQVAHPAIDLLVTTGHWMLVRDQPDTPLYFVMAISLLAQPYWLPTPQGDLYLTPEHCTYIEHYDDEVFCVEVPFHTLLVRRHGKTVWVGQTVSMEELRRQLGNAIPGAFQIAARAMSVTTQELEKMVRTGGMEAIPFVQALGEQLRKEFGGAAETAASSAAAAFARFFNELNLLKESLASSGLVQTLRDLANTSAEILETWRKARVEREKALGGAEPEIPRAMQGLSPAMQARQAEIERLRRELQGIQPGLTAAEGPFMALQDPAALRARLLALQTEQRKTITTLPSQLLAEGAAPGATGPSALDTAEDRLQKILDDGRKRLAALELDAQFIPSLTLAQDKLKAWQETLKAIREEFEKLSAPLRQSLLGANQGAAPSPYRNMIGPLAATRGVDPALVEALVAQESSNNPRAESRAGAKGLMQLMPGTAARFGAAGREFEPEANLKAGIAYLAELLKLFSGDVQKALTAYNAGPRGGGIPQATGENATFASDVLRRIPTGIGGVMTQAAMQETALIQATLQDESKIRDLAKQQTEELETRIIRRQAELITIRQGGEEAERFARRATAAQQAERLKDAPKLAGMTLTQQIADYTTRIADLTTKANALGDQVETQRANLMRPQLEAELQRIQTFMNRPDQSLADQARAQVEQQAVAMRASIERTLQTLAQHPALQDMAERFQGALAGLGPAAAEQAQIAFDKVDTSMRDRVTQMGDQIDQIRMKIGASGLDPLATDLERIKREFAAMEDQLLKLQAALGQLAPGATPERQLQIAGQQDAIKEALARRAPAEQAALRERQLRPETEHLDRLRDRLEQLQGVHTGEVFGASQEDIKLRQRGDRKLQTPEGRKEAEQLQAQIREQERLNYLAGLFEELGGSVASAWTNALFSIADGTKSVGQAFRDMARSILQSMAQIAAQESFRALFRLGASLIAGAAVSGGTSGGGVGGAGQSFDYSGGFTGGVDTGAFQHGGIVERPTMALIGEGPAHLNPEFVVNRPQMQAIMNQAIQRAPSAGGQAAGITIINVSSRAEAAQQKAQQEAMGRKVIVNEILAEMSQGESSRINRMVRSMQR